MVCSIAGLVVVLALAAAPAPALAGQSAAPAAKGEAKDGKAPARAETVVNLNTATQADLESLPGIGKSTAQRILDYRQKSGGFKKVEDRMDILELARSSGAFRADR
jgi:competence protein ComEA